MPTCLLSAALLVCGADDPLLAKFADARKAFDAGVQAHRKKAVGGYDRVIEFVNKVNAGVLPASERDQLAGDLRAARDEFARTGVVKSVGAVLTDVHIAYLTGLQSEGRKLTDAANQYSDKLKPTDPRASDMRRQAAEARDALAGFDLLQKGSKWDGHRGDFASPAVLKNAINPVNLKVRLRVRQPGAVDTDWHLAVTERKGSRVEGVVSQNGKAAKWKVEGTFDGLNLAMQSTEMVKGKSRAFVYAGQVAGGVGVLEQDGVKTNGQRGVGAITLELRP